MNVSNTTSPRSMNAPGDFHWDLSQLNPGTTYYFRAKTIGDGATHGDIVGFTTLGERRSPESTTEATPSTTTTTSSEPQVTPSDTEENSPTNIALITGIVVAALAAVTVSAMFPFREDGRKAGPTSYRT